jgi:hypothetical protein
MKGLGSGQGYRYVHDDPGAQEDMPCLPERFQGRDYLGEASRRRSPPIDEAPGGPHRSRSSRSGIVAARKSEK